MLCGGLAGLKRMPREIESVPQRLKPRYEQSTFGTAEAVPLSKTDLSVASEIEALDRRRFDHALRADQLGSWPA